MSKNAADWERKEQRCREQRGDPEPSPSMRDHHRLLDGLRMYERWEWEARELTERDGTFPAIRKLKQGTNEVSKPTFRTLVRFFCDTLEDANAAIKAGRLVLGSVVVIPRTNKI